MLPPAEVKKYEDYEITTEIKFVKDHTEYGRSYTIVDEGETVYIKPGKQFNSELVKGKTYKIKVSRKVGTKTWYISSAEPLDKTAYTKQEVSAPKSEPMIAKKDEMSKEEWLEKENRQRWGYCLNSAVNFYSRRPDATVEQVLEFASRIYSSSPEAIAVQNEKITATPSAEDVGF